MSLLKSRAPWTVVLVLACFYSNGAFAEDAKVPADLAKTIDESIKLLEEKSYGPFLERMVSPFDLEKMKKTREDLKKDTVNFPSDKAEFLLKIFKHVKTLTPKMIEDGNIATYTLKEIGEERPFVMQKTEGKWYLRN